MLFGLRLFALLVWLSGFLFSVLFGFRLLALLAGLRGLRLSVFSRVTCVAHMLSARARVVVHVVISYCLCVWPGCLWCPSVVCCRRSSLVVWFPID